MKLKRVLAIIGLIAFIIASAAIFYLSATGGAGLIR